MVLFLTTLPPKLKPYVDIFINWITVRPVSFYRQAARTTAWNSRPEKEGAVIDVTTAKVTLFWKGLCLVLSWDWFWLHCWHWHKHLWPNVNYYTFSGLKRVLLGPCNTNHVMVPAETVGSNLSLAVWNCLLQRLHLVSKSCIHSQAGEHPAGGWNVASFHMFSVYSWF